MSRLQAALLRRGESPLPPDDLAAAQIASDWVWPHWLERQLDPASTAFVPQGHRSSLVNLTGRNWTAVGNLDSPYEAVVDPRGLVTPRLGGWSLDWWIGAEDRWHLPSREVGVRQHLVDASPVVETSMRVPGGDAVQRAYAMRRSSTEGGGELIVVEFENASKVPVALALAVRPCHPEGLATVDSIDLHDAVVTVNGQVALLLPKTPPASAASTFGDGDSAETVLAGDAPDRWPGPVRCARSLAQAGFVYPLAHGATLRVGLPLSPQDRPRRWRRARRPQATPAELPVALPAPGDVARGWKSQSNRGMRLELPDDRLAEAVDANRRSLLLLHRGAAAVAGRFLFRDAALMLDALDHYGYADEAAEVLASFPERQRADGSFASRREEPAANGAALWSLARHWRLTHDRQLVEAMVGAIGAAANWIERARQGKGASDRDLPYLDDFWGVAGLRAAAELFSAAGQHKPAVAAARDAEAYWADLEGSLERSAERLGSPAVPAGPQRRIDAGVLDSLAAAWPLEVMAPEDERMAATADIVRARFTVAEGRAIYQGLSPTGLSPSRTMQLAGVELAAGDRRCLDRLAWLLDAATGTWTWPEVIHPRVAGGSGGDGQHGPSGAELLRFVRHLLVREVTGGLALATVVPDEWLGQGWAVHDAPTAHGLMSYAIRWHGDRPALLWDLRGFGSEGDDETITGDGPAVKLTTPGLDPTWSTTERRGEALLAPVAPSG